MSWKFAGIIFQDQDKNNVLESFKHLEKTNSSVDFNEALKSSFKEYGIGKINQAVVIFNHILPYESDYGMKTLSKLDETLATLSKNSKALCFFIDGVTDTYGISLFENGVKVRSKQSISGSPSINYGAKLPEEETNKEDEELIFDLIGSFLNEPPENLIFSDSTTLSVYKEK